MKKMSMELMYVPQATVSQKKEMVMEWRAESDNTYKLSMISAGVSFMAMLIFIFGKEDFWYIYAGSSIISLLSGYMAKRWSVVGYGGVIVPIVLNCLWFALGLPEKYVYVGSIIFAAICTLLPLFSAIRCLLNYSEVFVPLRESKGFPDFIMSTSDLYGDKLYLKDKPDGSVQDNRYEASYNPFKNESDIAAEEFRRSQELKARDTEAHITMNIDDEGNVVRSIEPRTYKHGRTIGSFEMEFLHNDFEDMTYQEKATLMGKWRSNIAFAERNFYIFFICMMMAGMIGGFGSLLGVIVRDLVLVTFTLGISSMKQGRTWGAVMILCSIVYSFCMVNNVMALMFMVAGYIADIGIITAPIKFLINKRIYNRLSEMDGFPTFIRTTSDIYGSQMYIAEDRPRVEKRSNKDHFITMDIGYDEEKKLPEKDKAWNAFDYMDEENKEKESND